MNILVYFHILPVFYNESLFTLWEFLLCLWISFFLFLLFFLTIAMIYFSLKFSVPLRSIIWVISSAPMLFFGYSLSICVNVMYWKHVPKEKKEDEDKVQWGGSKGKRDLKKRTRMYYAHVPTSHKEWIHYILHTCTNQPEVTHKKSLVVYFHTLFANYFVSNLVTSNRLLWHENGDMSSSEAYPTSIISRCLIFV